MPALKHVNTLVVRCAWSVVPQRFSKFFMGRRGRRLGIPVWVLFTLWHASLSLGLHTHALYEQRRNCLLYNHVPKCGGKYAAQALTTLVSPEHLRVINEYQKSTLLDQRRCFVVSSIRDPCDYYLSLFSYGRGGHGALRNKLLRKFSNEPEMRTVYEGARFNHTKFDVWLNHTAGIYSERVYNSHPDLAVDCWVRTPTADADLVACVHRFWAQGGMKALTATATLSKYDATGSLLDARVHPSEHGACENYITANIYDRVLARDQRLCDVLNGGCTCCGKMRMPPIYAGASWTRRRVLGSNSPPHPYA